MSVRQIRELVDEALAIEAQKAKDAGVLGYMARALVQATMPHRPTKETVFERRNGAFSMLLVANPRVGLPYGTYPRLLLAWLTTEAVRTRSPELLLGPTLSGFMDQLGLIPAGGRWGTIPALRDRMKRLFTCSVSCTYEEETQDAGLSFHVAKEYRLWWDPKNPDQAALWQSTVTLSKDFFEEVIDRPVPVDMRAMQVLKRSPMALDIYCWLTYRMSYLKEKTEIPWPVLQSQFGADYADNPQGSRDFKRAFLKHLRTVLVVYKSARVEESRQALILKPGQTHVSTR